MKRKAFYGSNATVHRTGECIRLTIPGADMDALVELSCADAQRLARHILLLCALPSLPTEGT